MKTVKEERIIIHLVLEREGGVVKVSGQADYEVTSEDLMENRSLDIKFTPAQETSIKSFAQQIVNKVKQVES